MRGEKARLTADKKWGEWIQGFAYDLFGDQMWKLCRSAGLVRYGKEPSGGDSTRTISLAYQVVWGVGAWSPAAGSPALQSVGTGAPVAYRQPDNTPNAAKGYTSGFTVPANTGHTIGAYLYEPSKNQGLKLHQWWWGQPGSGFLFQIRDGKAEVGVLSLSFTLSDLAALNVLWGVKDPTLEQQSDINEKIALLFDKFQSLTFELSTGKSEWYNNTWALTFIPEPRGAVQVVLEGGDATQIEHDAILKTGKPGLLWDASPIHYVSGGGSFVLRSGYPWFMEKATAEFGPHREGHYYAGALGDAVFALNAYSEAGVNSVTAEKFDYSNMIDFGFRLTLSTTNRRKPSWIYGFSARLEPGDSTTTNDLDNPEFDTDKPYVPANPDAAKITGPVILDIVPNFDGGMNKTTYQVSVMNPLGLFSADKEPPIDCVANLTIDDEPLLTWGIITSIAQPGMRSLQRGTSDRFVVGGDGELQFEISNGWAILEDYECDPSPIGDNLHFGANLRAHFKTAGFRDWQIAGISATAGKIIKGAALGKEWACKADGDTSCADALRALMDSYGLGWRLFQNRYGVWQLVRIDTSLKASFTSTAAGLSNLTETGRLKIFRDIDITHTNEGTYNNFKVTGGENGEIVRTMPGPLGTLGRRRTKRLNNSGLRDAAAVQYALLSLEWAYGRDGIRGNYHTFFHKKFEPGDFVKCDGTWFTIEGLNGGSWAQDDATYSVWEVTPNYLRIIRAILGA